MRFRTCIAVVFCALFLTTASAQQSTIRGRVIYADTGRPLRRAEISLRAEDGEGWDFHTVTDRNGEFVISNLSAGKYLVVVNAPDIVNPLQQLRRNDSLEGRIVLGQIEDGYSEVTVDGRSSVKTEIRASRGGVITGRVLTESDEPIAKAQIKLFQIENGKLRPSVVTERPLDQDNWMFKTDSRGIYRIAGLASGEYIVRASESNEGGNPDEAAEGSYTNGSMMVAFHPKALRFRDATSVKVQQGSETTDVDIRFTERTAYRVSGTVVVRGKAARGANIKLTRDEPEDDRDNSGLTEALTDNNGHWEIRSVPDGNYTLSVSGYTLGEVHLTDEQRYVNVTPLRRELIVAGGDVTDLKFELVEGGTVAGVVSVEGGTKLPFGLSIELVSKRDGDEETAVANSYVKDKGAFSISQLPSGSFHFRISRLGSDLYVKSITLNGKDVLRNTVKVEEGKLVEGVRIVVASDLITVSGRAVDKGDRSKPLTNAAVLLFPAEAERRRMIDGPLAARTDKDGRFVVKGAPGDYFVFVLNRGRKDVPAVMPTEASLIKNAPTLQKISLQRGEGRVVEVVGP